VLGRSRSPEQDDELFCTDQDVIGILEQVGFCHVSKKIFCHIIVAQSYVLGWDIRRSLRGARETFGSISFTQCFLKD